jgi:hypothetical protein
MVREERVELSTFGSGGQTTPKPIRTKSNLANNLPVVNPDIRHLFWFLFWLKGEFIPKGIRRFTPENSRSVATERLFFRSGDGGWGRNRSGVC